MLSWIEIDSQALLSNYALFCSILGKDKTAPVLKSNAYGHGLKQCYQVLAPQNPEWICVNYVSEAETIRQAGFKGRLLLVGPLSADCLTRASKINAETLINSLETLEHWLKLTKKSKAHLKFDSGLSRQGFLEDQVSMVVDKVKPFANDIVGVASHFANVEDITEQEFAQSQIEVFDRIIAALQAKGFANLTRHMSSSASSLILTKSRYDLGRIGISLYGVWPSQVTRVSYAQAFGKIPELKPVLSWRTKIMFVKNIEAGRYVGYGCTYRANHDTTIALLPVGYFEGLPRLVSSSPSYVLIQGQRCQLLGRISMNMCVVDVSHLKGVKAGDEVTLIGKSGKEYLSASELAGWSQTIHYELLTRLNGDIPRIVK